MSTILDLEIAQTEGSLSETEQRISMESIRHDVLDHAYVSLEAIAVSLSQLVDRNVPMTPTFEGLAQQTIDYLSGGSMESTLVSLERYQGDALMQTRLSMESLVDTLKDIWSKIKLALQRAMQAVSDFTAAILGGVSKLENRILELEDTIKKSKRTSGEFTVRSPERLMIGGKVDPSVVEQGLKIITYEFYAGANTYVSLIGTYQEQIDRLLNTADHGKLSQEIARVTEVEAELTRTTFGVFKKYQGRTELPGGRAIEIKTTGSHFNAKEVLHSVKVVGHAKAKSISGTVTNPIPDPAWLLDRLAELKELISEFKSTNRATKIKDYVDRQRKMIEAIDKKLKEQSRLEKKIENEDGSVAIKGAMRSMRSDYVQALSRLDNYAFKYARAVLTYIGDATQALESE